MLIKLLQIVGVNFARELAVRTLKLRKKEAVNAPPPKKPATANFFLGGDLCSTSVGN